MLGNTTNYAYDLTTRTTRTTNPDTGVLAQTFDERGLVLSETDLPSGERPRTSTTRTGTRRLRTNALGERTTRGRTTRNGNPTSATDSRGRTTHATYDDFCESDVLHGRPGTGLRPSSTTIWAPRREIAESIGRLASTFTSLCKRLLGSPTTLSADCGLNLKRRRGRQRHVTDRLAGAGVTKATFDEIGRKLNRHERPAEPCGRTSYNPRNTLGVLHRLSDGHRRMASIYLRRQ